MKPIKVGQAKYTTKKAISKKIIKLQARIDFLKSIPTGCTSCASFDGKGCKRADGIAPPPDVIENGCPQWRWDEIAF